MCQLLWITRRAVANIFTYNKLVWESFEFVSFPAFSSCVFPFPGKLTVVFSLESPVCLTALCFLMCLASLAHEALITHLWIDLPDKHMMLFSRRLGRHPVIWNALFTFSLINIIKTRRAVWHVKSWSFNNSSSDTIWVHDDDAFCRWFGKKPITLTKAAHDDDKQPLALSWTAY